MQQPLSRAGPGRCTRHFQARNLIRAEPQLSVYTLRYLQFRNDVLTQRTVRLSSQVVLSSDEPAFGGYSNVTKDSDTVLATDEGTYDNRPHSFQVRSMLPWQRACWDPMSCLIITCLAMKAGPSIM